jgi:small Trp-rich protein
MWMLWLGLILLILKLLELGPFAELSWGWVILPLIGAFIWFELFEKRLGLDKKKAFDELDRAKKDRIKKAMEDAKKPRR